MAGPERADRREPQARERLRRLSVSGQLQVGRGARQERDEADTGHRGTQRRQAGELHDRRRDVDGPNQGVDLRAGRDHARTAHEQRHVSAGRVEEIPVLNFLVISQAFAVVGDEHDQRVRLELQLAQTVQQPADLAIQEGDLVRVGGRRDQIGVGR